MGKAVFKAPVNGFRDCVMMCHAKVLVKRGQRVDSIEGCQSAVVTAWMSHMSFVGHDGRHFDPFLWRLP